MSIHDLCFNEFLDELYERTFLIKVLENILVLIISHSPQIHQVLLVKGRQLALVKLVILDMASLWLLGVRLLSLRWILLNLSI